MATLNRVPEVSRQLGPLLAPGEQVRDVLRVDLTSGTDEVADAERARRLRAAVQPLARDPDAPPPGGIERAAGGVVDVIGNFAAGTSAFGTSRVPDLPDPNGIALRGKRGSLAVEMRDQLSRPGSPVLALTDRRLFVLLDGQSAVDRARAQESGSAEAPYEIVGSVDSTQLAGVARKPKGLLRGRVEVAFTDGSMLAVSALRAPLAERLVAAAPRPAPGPPMTS